MTDECVIAKGMQFTSKKILQRAVRMYFVKDMREFKVDDSNRSVWRLICRRHTQGYRWLLRGIAKPDGLWEITKFHPKHTCDMEQSRADHCNLDINMIAHVLLKHIEETQGCLSKLVLAWSTQNMALSGYMATLQHANPSTVVQWRLLEGRIFYFVFWAFKSVIDGFAHCKNVISIDGTHVYGRYDIKLLIAVGMDANGSIFPLAFAIAANESNETWGMFLTHLQTHLELVVDDIR
ncbi:uncharacterized protein LOC132048666 [Lycium ferocissimum]|uniref:uncharacterized protein LOC132048666 n=1 Tax=Lycium ferocissimum TaxID=112874 RepID=UPI002816542B|nr:uncharacterized protein LOC132048666 [Lycium ferocissimum]